jgi:spore coat protein U-like protein
MDSISASRTAAVVHSRTARLPAACLWLLAFSLVVPAAALAAGTASVPVNGTVLSKNVCKFRGSKSVTLAFGNIDPSSASAATASAGLVIRCAGSAALATYALTIDDGLHGTGPGARRMKHATLNVFLPYSVSLTPSSGTVVKNVDLDIAVDGSIAPASFQDANVGSYGDTLVVTLNP